MRSRPLRSSLLLLGLLPFLSASRPAPDWLETFRRINDEVRNNSRAYYTLGDATRTIGHRLTGTDNGRRAEEYTFNLLRSYGYSNARYFPFEVEAWGRDSVTLEVVPPQSDDFTPLRAVALAHSPVTAQLQGELVDAGNGLEADFEQVKDQVRGRVALVNLGIVPADTTKKNLHRSEKTALAIRYGATGIVCINSAPGGVLLTGTASVTGKLIAIPALCISREDGELVRRLMAERKGLRASIAMRNHSRLIRARNVIATLPGRGRERILIGGHLDSWDLASGAIDNGIGSFAILEIARVFKQLKLKPKRSIEFVMFMGEEQGLLGSEAYVQRLVKNKRIGRVACMVNLDMAGNPVGFNASGRSEMVPFLKEVGETIRQVEPTFASKTSNQASLHSDHQTFLLEGIPVLQPISNLNPAIYNCYHADCDNFNLVDKTHLDNSVRYTAMLLYALANADELPVRRLNSEETRDFLIKQNLKEELVLGEDWRW